MVTFYCTQFRNFAPTQPIISCLCVQAPQGEETRGLERSTFALFMQPDWYYSELR